LAKWLGKINWFGFGGNQMRVRDSSRKCLKNQMIFFYFYGFIKNKKDPPANSSS
jgi:hypothetical protein